MHGMQDEVDATAADLERKVHALRRAGKLKDAVALCKKLNHEFPNFQSGWYTASRLAMLSNECEWYKLPRIPEPLGVISTSGNS